MSPRESRRIAKVKDSILFARVVVLKPQIKKSHQCFFQKRTVKGVERIGASKENLAGAVVMGDNRCHNIKKKSKDGQRR